MTRSRHASNEGGNSVISGFQFVELFEEWRDKPNVFVIGLNPGHDRSLALADFHLTALARIDLAISCQFAY